ncbi:sigma 54-interacting transcriptional regulator [Ammoniphilus sp. CFH 90114]|uniref:sigma 54-interacting transcriptional regulator n=1 Tax=Ammoniphilus sp. CFH 90114 TaxID=2493665 RepID=UPI00100E56C7|nr:sigma 54-interacting transcriptional regulator [Ammoniphilus sp. CFH 90114]RXT06236.1 AAA family ATPase [Ammoniphilus sp. CFH 90114]
MQARERILILITGTLQTRLALTQQLQEIIGDLVEIQSYSLEEGIPCVFHKRFIILSTPLIEDETKEYISSNCEVITGNRTVNYQNIDKLWLIPQGTPILYVNDYRETAVEAIQSLIHLGIDQLEYIPYYPGKQGTPKIPLAVTPGEVDLVPEFVSEVIDLGPRLFDITSIMSILQKLELLEQRGIEVSEKYTRKIIDLSKNLAQASQAVNRINGHLYHVLNGVHHGILSVDEHGYITVLNENLGDLLRVNALRAIGRNVRSILPESIVSYILSDHEEGQAYFTIHQTDVVVQRFRIENDQSIVATFKSVRETLNWDQRVRKELVQKGYIAKYQFSDIIGNSSTIQETKRIAAKIAQTDLTVLIQGESGTGKELFASAIHNDSRRATGPFLAVNFSALPEDLVESELFGYEEGAFTGAKKGGKPGLFEQAQGGTIFLDEIGDISLKIQARLLRVLQEKEIMRVGGSKIIPVDVRVIAATNKDLLSMIDQGKFREDLYHRLKVLYLHLPSLRARDQDIELLIHHFIQTTEFINITILPEVIHYLGQYPWYGNVRELKHTLEYMLAVCEQDVMTLRDLPAEGFFQRSPMKPAVVDYTVSPFQAELSADEEVLLSILSTIQELNHAGQAAGRKKIADESGSWRHQLSEQQIRHRMNTLEERGWIVKSKGRSGTKLTQAGVDYLRAQKKGVH